MLTQEVLTFGLNELSLFCLIWTCLTLAMGALGLASLDFAFVDTCVVDIVLASC